MRPADLSAPFLHTTHHLRAAAGLAVLCLAGAAQAQWVPHAGHVWRQAQANVPSLATATVHLHASKAPNPRAERPLAGTGLSLQRWSGRAGVALDRDINPLKDSYVLAQPAEQGLRLRSLHILSDLELGSGFRASAGIVKGDITQAWWGNGDTDGGVHLSVQQLDRLSLPGADGRERSGGLRPYVGAGYRLSQDVGPDHASLHFSADLGLTRGTGLTLRPGEGLQLTPVVKFSMRYSF